MRSRLLQCTLPAGLCWTSEGNIERHPDRRLQHAIRTVFDKLSEFGSVRQVLMWLREENGSLPTLESERPREITWRLPTYRIVLSIVRNPFYAGAYAFGRRETRTRVVALPPAGAGAQPASPPAATAARALAGPPRARYTPATLAVRRLG